MGVYRIRFLAAAMIASLATSGALAQAAPVQQQPAPDVRASRLIGDVIENEQGWSIGKVQDVIVDPAEGRLAFIVLTAGSRFEAGESDLALAMPDERLRFDGTRLVWTEDLDSLRDLGWIKIAIEDEEEGVRARLARVSRLVGAPLRNRRGEHVGEIEDLVVNLGSGKVVLTVADYDRSWLHGGRLVSLEELGQAQRDDEGRVTALVVEEPGLASRPAFVHADWPALSDDHWTRRIERLVSPR